jgi:putative addiction module antidote
MVALKLHRIGDELGVVLPKEALAALGLGEGDVVYLSETSKTSDDDASSPEFDRQMQFAEEGMIAYRGTLNTLAQ